MFYLCYYLAISATTSINACYATVLVTIGGTDPQIYPIYGDNMIYLVIYLVQPHWQVSNQ